MRPGSTVSPEASMTSREAGGGPPAPLVMLSMRPSCTTMVASRTGGAPVPSISVAPRRMVIGLAESEAVEARGVLAGDLATHVGRQVSQLPLDVLARVRPHAVRMREVRSPHDLVDAELVEQLHADRVGLVRRPALALPVPGRRHLQREVLELVLPLGVHPPEHVGDPADARLAQ